MGYVHRNKVEMITWEVGIDLGYHYTVTLKSFGYTHRLFVYRSLFLHPVWMFPTLWEITQTVLFNICTSFLACDHANLMKVASVKSPFGLVSRLAPFCECLHCYILGLFSIGFCSIDRYAWTATTILNHVHSPLGLCFLEFFRWLGQRSHIWP